MMKKLLTISLFWTYHKMSRLVMSSGKGNVILDMYSPNGKIKGCQLADALLVKDSEAATIGKKFEFEQSLCKVVDEKHGVIAAATKYSNLYYLNCPGSIEDKQRQIAMNCASKSDESKEWV